MAGSIDIDKLNYSLNDLNQPHNIYKYNNIIIFYDKIMLESYI